MTQVCLPLVYVTLEISWTCDKDFFHLTQQQDAMFYTNVHRALLVSGAINALHKIPLCLFNIDNHHYSDSTIQHVPVPLTRILVD